MQRDAESLQWKSATAESLNLFEMQRDAQLGRSRCLASPAALDLAPAAAHALNRGILKIQIERFNKLRHVHGTRATSGCE